MTRISRSAIGYFYGFGQTDKASGKRPRQRATVRFLGRNGYCSWRNCQRDLSLRGDGRFRGDRPDPSGHQGEIDKNSLTKLIISRGKLEGDKPLTDEYVKSATSYATLDKISQEILEDKFKYKDISNVKPIFRLNPPKKGYEGIKRSFVNKGALGYRGKDINRLLERMI